MQETFEFLKENGFYDALGDLVDHNTAPKEGFRMWLESTHISETDKFVHLGFLETPYMKLAPSDQLAVRQSWAFIVPWFNRLAEAGVGNDEFWDGLQSIPESQMVVPQYLEAGDEHEHQQTEPEEGSQNEQNHPQLAAPNSVDPVNSSKLALASTSGLSLNPFDTTDLNFDPSAGFTNTQADDFDWSSVAPASDLDNNPYTGEMSFLHEYDPAIQQAGSKSVAAGQSIIANDPAFFEDVDPILQQPPRSDRASAGVNEEEGSQQPATDNSEMRESRSTSQAELDMSTAARRPSYPREVMDSKTKERSTEGGVEEG